MPQNPDNMQSVVDSPLVIQTAESPASGSGTYGQILKASATIGGSSVLNIAIGMVRTKAMAVLLGPGGFGLFGLYGSISICLQTY